MTSVTIVTHSPTSIGLGPKTNQLIKVKICAKQCVKFIAKSRDVHKQ